MHDWLPKLYKAPDGQLKHYWVKSLVYGFYMGHEVKLYIDDLLNM